MIQENTVIRPTPSAELLREREQMWELVLPMDYKEFIMKYNGGIPGEDECSFLCGGREYVITRFLCVLDDIQKEPDGWYDIDVVESQIGERLTDNEDLTGIEVLPVAELFGGDYVCIDFRKKKKRFWQSAPKTPSVCVWSNEESGEFDPVTYHVADSFADFLEKLK